MAVTKFLYQLHCNQILNVSSKSFAIIDSHGFILMFLQKCFLLKKIYRKDFWINTVSHFQTIMLNRVRN